MVSIPQPVTETILSYLGYAGTSKGMWTQCGGKVDDVQIVGCADKEVGHSPDDLTWAYKPDPSTCVKEQELLENLKGNPDVKCWEITYTVYDDDGWIICGGTILGHDGA